MRDNHAFGILVVVAVLCAVLGLFYWANQQRDCDARHGVLVRGAVGYSCVAQP
jgi:hypothetical protein